MAQFISSCLNLTVVDILNIVVTKKNRIAEGFTIESRKSVTIKGPIIEGKGNIVATFKVYSNPIYKS